MSWVDYVQAYLVNFTESSTGKSTSNVCDQGTIVGNTDGTVWASTLGFSLDTYMLDIAADDGSTKQVEVNEFRNLLDVFAHNGTTSLAGGVRIHREKYLVVCFDADRGVLYLRKKGGGACVCRSNQAFVIGTFSEAKTSTAGPQSFGMMNRACEGLQEFLLANNM